MRRTRRYHSGCPSPSYATRSQACAGRPYRDRTRSTEGATLVRIAPSTSRLGVCNHRIVVWIARRFDVGWRFAIRGITFISNRCSTGSRSRSHLFRSVYCGLHDHAKHREGCAGNCTAVEAAVWYGWRKSARSRASVQTSLAHALHRANPGELTVMLVPLELNEGG